MLTVINIDGASAIQDYVKCVPRAVISYVFQWSAAFRKTDGFDTFTIAPVPKVGSGVYQKYSLHRHCPPSLLRIGTTKKIPLLAFHRPRIPPELKVTV